MVMMCKYRWNFLLVIFLLGESTMAQDSLKKYRAKRNVKASGEPAAKVKKGHKLPIFTIQKHDASHLHYDFRIEVDGVMPSWAVPKGPTLDPKIKRLAIMTEDHPLDYATFEGTIAEGNYGAGQVIVWDTGTYENIKHDHEGNLIPLAECIERGTVEIFLHGKKLQGGFALIRTHLGDGKDWLLIKMKDKYADSKSNPVKSKPQSVLSGKTIEDVKSDSTVLIPKKKITRKKLTKIKKLSQDDPAIVVDGTSVQITHPDKVIFPKDKITKKEFVDYYELIAPIMLPYLKDRPLSMQRFVDGIDKPGFYQKEAGSYFPDYIDQVTIKKQGGVVHEVVVNNAPSLVYLANQLVITFHRWLSTTDHLDYPNIMIFDLDPAGSDFGQVRAAALMLKKILEKLDLVPFVMTTGSKGLHVVVPLKGDVPFDDVRSFAHDIAQIMADGDPENLTLEMRKDKRAGRIFVDYLRNSSSATAVCPYSVRPKEGAPVATPIEWSEVSKKTLKPDRFTIKNIFKRLERKGDVWKDMRKDAVSLKKAQKKLEKIKKGSE